MKKDSRDGCPCSDLYPSLADGRFAVNQTVSQETDREGNKNINDGMLLEEYRRHTDEQADNNEGRSPFQRTEPFAVQCRAHDSHGINDMQGWRDIRIGIKQIELADKPGQQVIPRKHGRPEILDRRKQNEDDQGERVGDDDVFHHAAEILFVTKKQVGEHPDQIDEPEHVWENEPFIKGNKIIHPAIGHDVILDIAVALQVPEHHAEQRPEKQQCPILSYLFYTIHFGEHPFLHRQKRTEAPFFYTS